jgi:hypothetical protein
LLPAAQLAQTEDPEVLAYVPAAHS